MSAVLAEAALHPALESARQQALPAGLPYAGSVPPADAWALVQRGEARLVDARSAEERKFVGQAPGSLAVPGATGTALTCRSGKRSALAAEAAAKAGFAHVFNVLEGFEGELDSAQQRGTADGWRFRGLPWTQD